MKYRNLYIYPKFSEGEKVYYGNVSGIPEIELVEAANLEDFERLFHEAVDDYLDRKRDKCNGRRTSLIVTISAFVILVAIALVTCPDKNKHVNVLKDRLGSVLNEQTISEKSSDLEVLGMALVNRVLGRVIDNFITVDDYALFSLGRLSLKDHEDIIVSIGIFGHVFTKSKEQMRQALSEIEKSYELYLKTPPGN